MNQQNNKIVSGVLYTAIGVGLIYVVSKHRKSLWHKIRLALDFRNPLRYQKIHIINNVEECRNVVKKLKLNCKEYNVLGFDCEWTNTGGNRRPVALLQLASSDGLCALIRLCHLKQVPQELRDILEDDEIIKVGVAPHDDATYLARDYGVCVASTLDLRHVATLTNIHPEGLGKLSKTLLNVELDKSWRIRCSDWEAKILSEPQKIYAAKDAHVAIEIFKKMLHKHKSGKHSFASEKAVLKEFLDLCYGYLDRTYKVKSSNPSNASMSKKNIKLQQYRGLSTRTKPLYDNCYMEAPDGEMLCTCDRKKAEWYISKGLATAISADPYTVRLNFEPAGRAVGEVGQYYLLKKKNECVICGKSESYIRKNVVPREYRKLFPEIMKDHSSHDVVLLCTHCHQTSNMTDLNFRKKLAEMCGAPIISKESGVNKYQDLPDSKKIRSAARALLHTEHEVPEPRKVVLRNIIHDVYPDEELTQDFLQELMNIPVTEAVENYTSHGQQVVKYFNESRCGGLVELERMWRQHFLDSMRPKHLPELWSVTHNANRLEIRADEGRIKRDELISVGLDPSKLKERTTTSEKGAVNLDLESSATNDDIVIQSTFIQI